MGADLFQYNIGESEIVDRVTVVRLHTQDWVGGNKKLTSLRAFGPESAALWEAVSPSAVTDKDKEEKAIVADKDKCCVPGRASPSPVSHMHARVPWR